MNSGEGARALGGGVLAVAGDGKPFSSIGGRGEQWLGGLWGAGTGGVFTMWVLTFVGWGERHGDPDVA